MADKGIRRRKYKTAPGIIVECKSGRYLAFYEHRTDIVANGDSAIEAKKNLKEMYGIIMKHEKDEEESKELDLPKDFKLRKFTEKIPH